MNEVNLKNILNLEDYPINEANWLKKIQNQFDETGIVSLENFVLPESMDNIKKESEIVDLIKSKDYLENIDVQEDSELEKKFKENPNDLNTRFEMAKSQIINKDYSEAINNLLFVIEKNKDWNNNKAKTELLNMFSLLGDTDPLTMEGRTRLSNLIFK